MLCYDWCMSAGIESGVAMKYIVNRYWLGLYLGLGSGMESREA